MLDFASAFATYVLERPTRKIRGKISEKLLDNPLTKGTYSQLKTGYESAADRATQYAQDKGVDKMGGILGHYAGQVENMWYTAQGRGKGSGGDDSSGDSSVEEPGTRATTSRRFDYGQTGTTQSRRSLLTGGDTERNPGKKAKKLSRRTGGR